MDINEQVKDLRKWAEEYLGLGFQKISELLREAANTIESLSAKLADMERPGEDCGGWIPCKDRLPDVEVSENVKSGICTDNGERFLITDTEGYVYESTFWLSTQEFEDDAIAWMPKPEPYHEP